MDEFIKNNDHYLETYIAKQAIEKIPVFTAFRKFCEKVGNDAMEYRDFEFWYYRFYHGHMDFDYDRSADSKPKTIMDMPVSLMYKITGYLDTVERAYLRSMNKSIKHIAGSYAPTFDKIVVGVSDEDVHWELDDKYFACEEERKGCILDMPNKPDYIYIDDDFLKIGMKYLTPVFQIPRIQAHHITLSMSGNTTVLDDLLPVPFHARSVKIYTPDGNKTLQLLSIFVPGEVESIDFRGLYTHQREVLSRFFETEYFKQAKHVELSGYFREEDLLKFKHLKSFKCELDHDEQVNFQNIREIILTFEQFESCELKRNNPDFYFLGQEIPDESVTINHRYKVPKSNEYLEFKVEDHGPFSYIRIVKVC
ncbi:unnamed protein product [Caenorhabditis nigoni]